jgi:uncharacterized membrane protein
MSVLTQLLTIIERVGLILLFAMAVWRFVFSKMIK